MRVVGWHVEVFGSLHDWTVEGLPAGVTVVLGANEAGKSTLLGFLRAMLFGLPDARSRQGRRVGSGARFGGQLFLYDERTDEQITVDRQGRTVTVTSTTGDRDLSLLLGGADERLFRTVFAFDLGELEAFSRLTDPEIADRVFSAGVAGAGREVHRVLHLLEVERETLFRPRAPRRLRQLHDALRSNAAQLELARRRAADYPELLQKERQAQQAVEEIARTIDRLRTMQRRAERLLELWPGEVALRECEAKRSALPPVRTLPPDAALRAERLRGALDRQRQEYAGWEARQRQTLLRLDGCVVDERLVQLAPEVERCLVDGVSARDWAEMLLRVREEEVSLRGRLGQIRDQLGPRWDDARIRGFDVSLAVREELRLWRGRLEDSERVMRAAQVVSRHAEEARAAAAAAVEAREAEKAAFDGRTVAAVEDAERALAQVRQGLEECLRAAVDVSARTALVTVREEAAARGVGRDVRWVGWGAVLLLAGTAVMGWLARDHGLGLVTLAVAMGGAVGLIVWERSRRTVVSRLLAEVESARREAALAQERQDAAERSLAQAAQAMGLPPRPDVSQVEERAAELRESQRSLGKYAYVLQAAEEARTTLARAEEAATRARSEEEVAAAAWEEARQGWVAWRVQHGMPEDVSPDGLRELLEVLAVAQDLARSIDAAVARSLMLQESLEKFGAEADRLVGSPVLTTDVRRAVSERLAALRALQASAAVAVNNLAERQRLLTEAETQQKEIARAAERVSQAEAEYRALIAGREDGDENLSVLEERFAAALLVEGERRTLTERIEDLRRRREQDLGHGPLAEELDAALSTGDVEGWRRQVAECRVRLTEEEAHREDAIRQHRDAEMARQALEADTDLAQWAAEGETLRQEWEEAVQRFRVLSLAGALLRRTLATYTRTRQPAVLRHASEVLLPMTGGRYPRVVQGESEYDLRVIDALGRPHAPEELSRGTAEQLYFAVRLGLAASFGERAVRLPLVLDEVLVNFDPVRTEAAIRALFGFAQRHQVLLFTCHPEVVACCRAVQPDCHVIPLEVEAWEGAREVAAEADSMGRDRSGG